MEPQHHQQIQGKCNKNVMTAMSTSCELQCGKWGRKRTSYSIWDVYDAFMAPNRKSVPLMMM